LQRSGNRTSGFAPSLASLDGATASSKIALAGAVAARKIFVPYIFVYRIALPQINRHPSTQTAN
jgi:hypothetical protein